MRLDDLEGQVVGERFRLAEMVGKGGYGAVFRGEQLSMGRRCAVKILLPGRGDEEMERRFQAEARVTSQLTHPNTVVVYDFGVDQATGLLFLATEYLDGFTLHEELEVREHLSVERAVAILEQVGASLEDAHRQGLVHRDIKPKNVMLVERAGRDDYVKVIDFGIAKVLHGDGSDDQLTQTGMMIGTPQYMPPEQLVGKDLDGRADQYALALVGYKMLTGINPFRADSPMETAMRHVNDYPLPLRTYRRDLAVGDEFEAVLLRALEKEPEDRFATMGEFIAALKSAGEVKAAEVEEPATLMLPRVEPSDDVEDVEEVQDVQEVGEPSEPEEADTISVRSAPVPVLARRSRGRSVALPGLLALGVFGVVMLLALVIAGSGGEASQERGPGVAEGSAAVEEEEGDEPGRESAESSWPEVITMVDEGVATALHAALEKAEALAEEEEEDETPPQRREFGAVTVTLIPWGTLHVNGRPRSDQTRQEVRLPVGRHVLTLHQEGEVRARQTVDVEAGSSTMVVLEADLPF